MGWAKKKVVLRGVPLPVPFVGMVEVLRGVGFPFPCCGATSLVGSPSSFTSDDGLHGSQSALTGN